MIRVADPLHRYNLSAAMVSAHFDPLHADFEVTGQIALKPKRSNVCNTVTDWQHGPARMTVQNRRNEGPKE